MRSLAAAVAAGPRHALALLVPQRAVAWTYADLDVKARRLASGLQGSGYGLQSIAFAADANSPEDTLLLQIAAAHVGAAVATPPTSDSALRSLSAKYDVRGTVCSEQIADFVERCEPRELAPVADETTCAGVFGGAAITHDTVMRLGRSAQAKLQITGADVVCCASTLLHSFGIGSAVASTLGAGACVVLPAPEGAPPTGHGDAASATLDALAATRSTLLFADTGTLEAMRRVEAPAALALRGGVIKISSGADFLLDVVDVAASSGDAEEETGPRLPLELGGVQLTAMGRRAFWVGKATTQAHRVSSTSSVI